MDGFSTRVKQLRKSFDVTQAALASQIGVEPSAVGKYESGKQAFPRVEVLVKMAEFFKVSIDYLISGIQSSPAIENNISGVLSNSRFIQANNGGIVCNGEDNKTLSPEAVELLHIYESLSGRERLRLLNYAVELERGKG